MTRRHAHREDAGWRNASTATRSWERGADILPHSLRGNQHRPLRLPASSTWREDIAVQAAQGAVLAYRHPWKLTQERRLCYSSHSTHEESRLQEGQPLVPGKLGCGTDAEPSAHRAPASTSNSQFEAWGLLQQMWPLSPSRKISQAGWWWEYSFSGAAGIQCRQLGSLRP